VNINPSNRAFELEYVLRQSECRALLLIESFRSSNYVEAIRQVCPEIDQAETATLHSPALPELRRLIFIRGQAPKGMISWDDLLSSGGGVSVAFVLGPKAL
jgi:fatty-acyl-CoA synthase